jgi:hypothetical protein
MAWMAVGSWSAVAATPTPAEERAVLLAQQQQLTSRYDLEASACRERFLVTDCIDEVNRRRRQALAPVRERLMQIDEAERQRRADERRQTLATKQKIREERLAAASAASAASSPRERQRMLPLANPLAPRPESAEAQRQQAAAERARQAQQRQAEAAERQARVARRLAEREARKGPVQPLPVPAAASASTPR